MCVVGAKEGEAPAGGDDSAGIQRREAAEVVQGMKPSETSEPEDPSPAVA